MFPSPPVFDLVEILPLLALGLAVLLALWRPSAVRIRGVSVAPWSIALLVCLGAGMASGMLTIGGVLVVGLLFVCGAWQARHREAGWAALLFGVVALALALHKVPGIHNLLLVQNVTLSEGALPFTLYANLDKGLAGLALLIFAAQPRSGALSGAALWRQTLLPGLVTAALVLGLASVLGEVRFRLPVEMAPAWTQWAWRFMLVNLLFTCVAEEAFFRGLIQGRIGDWLQRAGRPAWPAIIVSGALFGAAHLGGGALYALLAGMAGVGYGWTALRTGRVEAAIAVHFGLNALHFLFFTYPRLA